MHADSGSKLHEVTHRRIHESGTRWSDHIDICVRNHGPAAAIDDLPVDAGNVIQIFVADSIGTSGCKMSIAPGTDRRSHHRSPITKQISFLISSSDLPSLFTRRAPQ